MADRGFASGLKGPHAEELLRNYFLKAGYFVVRGVPFTYEGFDVTDIDLWLYNRVSSVSREISIVDIKSKKTPQSIERIFWTKGLQVALGVSKAIVATTDSREELKAFGKDLDILVLDGQFLRRLSGSFTSSASSRLTDEDFRALVEQNTLGKLDGNWIAKMKQAKAKLAGGLSFDSCNYWLTQGRFFAEQVLSRQSRRELGLRCLYILASYAALAVDYILRDLSFLEESNRERILRDGFIYGARGRAGTKNLIEASVGLIEQFADGGSAVSNQIRNRVDAEIAALPANVLSQYFSKSETGRTLFDVAKELEALSTARIFQGHSSASVGTRSLVGCLLDFWGLDRREFSIETQQSVQADAP